MSEEEDYMSDAFLATLEDVRPGLKRVSYQEFRKQSTFCNLPFKTKVEKTRQNITRQNKSLKNVESCRLSTRI